MIDVFNISSQKQQTFTFYCAGAGVWQTWNKPRNAKMIQIFCLGGGGGGGSSIASVTTSSGGGGGASGGIVRGLIPAFLLPDTIYILVGRGGVGGTTGNNGGLGAVSYIGTQPSILDQTLICKSSTTLAGGGLSTSVGGTAPTISVVTLSAFGNLGLFTAIAGVDGSLGGGASSFDNSAYPGEGQSALGTNLVTGGCGGGGSTSPAFGTGGTITSSSVILTTQVNGGILLGQNGDYGYGTLQPFCGTGGAGGAGGTTGFGGAGGDGFYGCGGGGGGGAVTGGIEGRGGNGGDGLIIISVIV